MSTALPTEAKFLLCEGFRPEGESKKITVLGLFPGEQIVLGDFKPGKTSLQLAVLAIFKGNTAPIRVAVEFRDPDRKEIPATQFNSADLPFTAGTSTTVGLQWIGLPIHKLGDYTVDCKVSTGGDKKTEEKTFTFVFNVKQ